MTKRMRTVHNDLAEVLFTEEEIAGLDSVEFRSPIKIRGQVASFCRRCISLIIVRTSKVRVYDNR